MNTSEHILHTASLKNNCPICYTTNGLEITFIQEEIENWYSVKNQKEILETIYCQNCKNTIYPVNWNENIEKTFSYHKKQAIPRSSQLRLKKIAYMILIGLMTAILLTFYLVSLA
ncbi:MAG: hypothetical protein ACI9AT_001861 [Ulvibacter sp.]|jgi:hypothetical protein